MAEYEFNSNTFFIDNILKPKLDKKVFPDLNRKDKDVVFGVDGKERSGKSVFAMCLGAYSSSVLGTPFDLSNVCMTPEEFRNKVQSAPKKSVVIYDEAHRGMGSRRALSEINNMLIDLMMEMGQKNLFVLIVMPTFFMLDRYPALYRIRGLFHIYEHKGSRGYWAYFNEKKKKKLYLLGKKLFDYNCIKWGHLRGRFFNQYPLNETEYRLKKEKAFKDKPRITKAEVFVEQRNKLLYLIHKEMELSSYALSDMVKKYKVMLQPPSIREIIGNIKEETDVCR